MTASLREADGGAIIESTATALGRRVAGVVLMLIGAWLGWQVVRAIAASRASTNAAWTAYVPGVLLFGAIALAFLVPGALMLFYRRYVRVDPGNHVVTQTQVYLGYRRARAYPLETFKTIVLARRTVQRGRTSTTGRRGKAYSTFVVELAPGSGKALKVATEEHEAPAREVAGRLASMTGLRIVDRIKLEREREEAGQDYEEDEDNDA